MKRNKKKSDEKIISQNILSLKNERIKNFRIFENIMK